MRFRPTHKPLRAFISSAKAGDIHFCMPVASWSLVTWYSGEHRHCKCGIRQRFKEERMCKHIHTTLPQVGSDCCMSRSTYALLPYSLHKWPLAHHSPTKICTIQSNKHLPYKPMAPSKWTFLSKHLFIPNKFHIFAADNCIKSGNICPPTGQLS